MDCDPSPNVDAPRLLTNPRAFSTYSQYTECSTEKRISRFVSRYTSDSSNDVVEKHQHMPDRPWQTDGWCHTRVNSATDFGASTPEKSIHITVVAAAAAGLRTSSRIASSFASFFGANTALSRCSCADTLRAATTAMATRQSRVFT